MSSNATTKSPVVAIRLGTVRRHSATGTKYVLIPDSWHVSEHQYSTVSGISPWQCPVISEACATISSLALRNLWYRPFPVPTSSSYVARVRSANLLLQMTGGYRRHRRHYSHDDGEMMESANEASVRTRYLVLRFAGFLSVH